MVRSRKGRATTEERRAHRRAPLKAVISLTSENNFYSGFTIDISRGGIFVATETPLPLHYACEVEFTLPDERGMILATCEVQWVRAPGGGDDGPPPGMGLRFLELPDEAQERIDEFVEQRDPLLYV